jgi:mRNA-degrading endonuclease RelE of RelBE toxin-antitoxin system
MPDTRRQLLGQKVGSRFHHSTYIHYLQWFKKREQNIIVDGIAQRLLYEPTKPNRNRKMLRRTATATWELRIGDFRTLYNADVLVRIVEIRRIGEKRGNALYFRGQKEEI